MSIIQEALRRKAEEEAAAVGKPLPPVVRPSLQTPPAHRPPRRDGRSRSRPAVWWGLLLLVMAAAIYSVVGGSRKPKWNATSENVASPPETPAATVPVTAPVDSPADVSSGGDVSDRPTPMNVPATPSVETAHTLPVDAPGDAPAEVPAEPVVPAPEGNNGSREPSVTATSSAAVSWPSLDLQGIVLRRPPHPSLVLINGRKLRVGDAIEGVRVADVEEDQVWMEREGQRRALRLGEPWD